MIGALLSFMSFLKLEPTKAKKEEEKLKKENQSEIIELDEEQNYYTQKSEIVISYVNGKEIKEEIIEEIIPLTKNTAKRQISKQRIK
ncbi:hypothetical protein [Campylobacter helveticus]|uniref:hypothetical protein n=1 Tax=Campylobacter helveticus TaxID=28898 RepID=UPI00214A3432|nr:hypothetical protein [Campylobacter helveticus]MCR2062494.1 hypothetical protein [Campylobacter helveticus]MCR2066867.1 hypothetical protein [Campylobacter helveticus]